MSKIKKIDHIGIAVSDLKEAAEQYERLGFKCAGRERLEEMGLEIAFFPIGESRLELIAPFKEGTTIAKFLAKHGPGLHHICFEVDNIDSELKSLADKGVQLIDKQARKGGAGMVAFIHPKSTGGVLIELAEKV